MSRNITSKIKRYNLIFYDINTTKSVLFSSIFVCKIVYGFCKLLIINTNCGAGGLYYQFSKEIEFVEDAMIEAKHPNDIGCVAYAKAYQRTLRKILR